MTYETLTFQNKDYITVITLGTEKGVFDIAQLSSELAELCDEIAWDEGTRVIVITGADDQSFSMDKAFLERPQDQGSEEEIIFWSLAEPISKLNQPVIAAINGNAVGQGLELCMVCDIRIAVDQSQFELPHIKAGLIPWDGGTQRLVHLVGRGKALQMVLTGERVDAHEAYRIGLVDKVEKPQDIMTSAMDMARKMASMGPIALRFIKEAVLKGMDMTLEQGLRLESDLYLLLHTTKDRTEGIQAFLEKRTPEFEEK